MNTTQPLVSSIVTGASRGIGAAIARRLAAQGHAVAVNYAGREADARSVVQAIEAEGGRAFAVRADVADPAQVREMFEAVMARHGRIDVVVNNAGVMVPGLPTVATMSDADFDRTLAVNFKGAFNVMREAALRIADGGRIVNLSSSVVGVAFAGYGAYAGTKAAVETMTSILAKELRGRRITVNAVAPGPTSTEMFLEGKSDEAVARLAQAAPLERLGEPEDIASVVAFLVGPDGGWVNGQTLRANGGMV